MTELAPFRIDIPDADLADLHRRLAVDDMSPTPWHPGRLVASGRTSSGL
ncbi:hypothetical protein ABT297_31945 [Dactylosporangium sp. NPDC000555]